MVEIGPVLVEEIELKYENQTDRHRQTLWKYDKIMLSALIWDYKTNIMRFYLQRALAEDADFCCVNYYNDWISCKGMMSNLFVEILAIYNCNIKTLTVKFNKGRVNL